MSRRRWDGKNNCRIGFRLGGYAHGFDRDHAERTAIDIFKARIFFKHHHIGLDAEPTYCSFLAGKIGFQSDRLEGRCK